MTGSELLLFPRDRRGQFDLIQASLHECQELSAQAQFEFVLMLERPALPIEEPSQDGVCTL